MRVFRITQAQLDEIFEHPLPDHAYQILANLPILKETVGEDPSSIPNIQYTMPDRKPPPVHETAGMWGEPKEEIYASDEDRSTTVHRLKERTPDLQPLRGKFTFDTTVRFLEEDPPSNFFEQTIVTYGSPYEPAPEVMSFREVMKREQQYQDAKEQLKKRAAAEYARCEELERTINDVQAGITKRIAKGMSVVFFTERLGVLKDRLVETTNAYNATMTELWGAQ